VELGSLIYRNNAESIPTLSLAMDLVSYSVQRAFSVSLTAISRMSEDRRTRISKLTEENRQFL
jgi:hypothetical protein